MGMSNPKSSAVAEISCGVVSCYESFEWVALSGSCILPQHYAKQTELRSPFTLHWVLFSPSWVHSSTSKTHYSRRRAVGYTGQGVHAHMASSGLNPGAKSPSQWPKGKDQVNHVTRQLRVRDEIRNRQSSMRKLPNCCLSTKVIRPSTIPSLIYIGTSLYTNNMYMYTIAALKTPSPFDYPEYILSWASFRYADI